MGRMKAKHRIADRLFFLLLTILVFSSCANSKKDIIPSAEYAPFVNAYTGGVISQHTYRTDAGSAYGRFEQ